MKKIEKKITKNKRPSWDEYFLQIVDIVGSRGTCDRGYNATVLVRDKRILATGYVGSPIGAPHCDDVGHEMYTVVGDDGKSSRHCIRTIHSELNAIANAARAGVALNGATLYLKFLPCYTCAKMIINAGILRVVCLRDYHVSDRSKKVFKEAGVKLDVLTKEIELYEDQ